jgi:light-regulated signal transduction histidine kinase (bacteriophytochrome)
MGMLIDDLLQLSRTSRAEMRLAEVRLEGLVKEAIEELRPETGDRRVAWTLDTLPAVNADRSLLRQVLVNLLSNALKYTRPRDPARIQVGCHDENALEWVLFVRDNGVGFDPAYAHKLFGVFQRLHRAEEFEGTGIGLANVRRIVARHGGRTWAEGKVNEGATFFFSLPKIQPNPS